MLIFRNVSLLSLSAITCLAAVPDAGSISSDIKKQLDSSVKHQTIPLQIGDKKENDRPFDIGTRVMVRSFKITGNTLISSKELSSVVLRFIGKEFSFTQLEDAARAIADYYREKGFSARAFLPPQEVVNGQIEIMVLEGKLSAIEIEAETAKRLSASHAKTIIETAHPTGKVLEIDKLQRGLLILNDTPGVTSASRLEAGEGAGDSKLRVKLQDAPLINGVFLGSNSGQRSTGNNQGIVSAGINSPSGIGDQITFQSMATHGIRYGKLGYTVPLGASGAKIGASYSAMSYYVVLGPEAAGTATTAGMNFSYPVIRSGTNNLTFNSTLDKKDYANYSAGTLISDKTAHVFSNGLTYTKFDTSGQTSLGFTYTLGYLNLKDNEFDYLADQQTKRSHGRYSKLSLNASRSQMITSTAFLSANLSAQKSSKNLDSGEKMYLGGSSGIRAYPSNEGGADEGYMFSLELSKSFANNFSGSLFYDYGRIKQNRDLYNGALTALNPYNIYDLKGLGLSTTYTQGTLSIKGTVSWRVGTNPNTQADGSDNDGTKDAARVWVSITKAF